MMSELVRPESKTERWFRPELGKLMFQDHFKGGQLVEKRLICFSEVNGITNKGKVESLARIQYEGEGEFTKPFFGRQSVDLKNNCLIGDRVLRYRPATIFELKGFMEKFADYMLEEVETKLKTVTSPVLVEGLVRIGLVTKLDNQTKRDFLKNILESHAWKNTTDEESWEQIKEEAAWNLLRWLNQVDMMGSILPDEFEKIEKSLEMARTKREWMWLADI